MPDGAVDRMGRLSLKVVPGSSRDEVVGSLADALKVKVKAPPEKERANEAVVAGLTAHLGVGAHAQKERRGTIPWPRKTSKLPAEISQQSSARLEAPDRPRSPSAKQHANSSIPSTLHIARQMTYTTIAPIRGHLLGAARRPF